MMAFGKRAEVTSVLTYVSSLAFARKYFLPSGLISASTTVPLSEYTDPIAKLSTDLLRDPSAKIGFDASDCLMPNAVGAGAFGTEMLKWISGQSTAATLDAIERTWPKP
jgi:alpha-glucoside transport system substrate-binding protein